MLEEIEMPPGFLGCVMHRAALGSAVGTGKARAWFKVDADVEAFEFSVEIGGFNEPWRCRCQEQAGGDRCRAYRSPEMWIDP